MRLLLSSKLAVSSRLAAFWLVFISRFFQLRFVRFTLWFIFSVLSANFIRIALHWVFCSVHDAFVLSSLFAVRSTVCSMRCALFDLIFVLRVSVSRSALCPLSVRCAMFWVVHSTRCFLHFKFVRSALCAVIWRISLCVDEWETYSLNFCFDDFRKTSTCTHKNTANIWLRQYCRQNDSHYCGSHTLSLLFARAGPWRGGGMYGFFSKAKFSKEQSHDLSDMSHDVLRKT